MEQWITNLFFFTSIYLEVTFCLLLYWLAQTKHVTQPLKRIGLCLFACGLMLVSPRFLVTLSWASFAYLCAMQPQYHGMDIGMAWTVMMGMWVNQLISVFCAVALCINFVFFKKDKVC
ncbi:Hypothetical protein mma_0934 [Janthinobacterium sp. Marseille]|uniref:Uncharacterized protein n=1 Tax=Herminiimonas aquatilis TaxID=345342 RepID=A0ABW2J5R3_9BURK|nr:hypothetical protein [Janthinobacterium sp. Marseille]ABR91944.1 Hypothetical protein mma_0934 [Janthinobacterium sp. Marseille]